MSNHAPVLSFADAGFGISEAVRVAAVSMMITMTITTTGRRDGSG
jgi:hypothetical protein